MPLSSAACWQPGWRGRKASGRYYERVFTHRSIQAPCCCWLSPYTGLETPITLIFAIAVIVFADGPIFAVVPTLAMNSSDKRTGTAAAMIVSAEMGIGSLAALAVSWIHDGTAITYDNNHAGTCCDYRPGLS